MCLLLWRAGESSSAVMLEFTVEVALGLHSIIINIIAMSPHCLHTIDCF